MIYNNIIYNDTIYNDIIYSSILLYDIIRIYRYMHISFMSMDDLRIYPGWNISSIPLLGTIVSQLAQEYRWDGKKSPEYDDRYHCTTSF